MARRLMTLVCAPLVSSLPPLGITDVKVLAAALVPIYHKGNRMYWRFGIGN